MSCSSSGARLELVAVSVDTSDVQRPVVFNEVFPGDGAALGFVEVYNRGTGPADLGGCWIVPSQGPSFRIPDGTRLDAGLLLVFHEEQLGFTPSLVGVRLALVARTGRLGSTPSSRPPHPPGGASGGSRTATGTSTC